MGISTVQWLQRAEESDVSDADVGGIGQVTFGRCFITARIRRMREGNIFRLFTPGGGGTPTGGGGDLPHPA